MEGDFIKINEWLRPFSCLYGIVVRLRNTLFDIGLLKSKSFDVPVISVGNITVGGTGKTPHVEYLVRLLCKNNKVAMLSRGYKRKKKGFIIADETTTASDIGDEPFQMHKKFPDITVAVDKKRVNGIEQLTAMDSQLDVILLDDAFQHRYVKPGINILLVDYHRLIIYDTLLPAGRLREPLSGKNRADIVIVTKCPKNLKPMEFRVITKAMDLYPYQHLYFTTLDYGQLQPVFMQDTDETISLKDKNILLITGIASPKQIIHDLKRYSDKMTTITFGDHHEFKKKDIDRINETFEDMKEPRCIVTTEKDAARFLQTEGLSEEVKKSMFYLPVEIKFMADQKELFNENIIGYVRKNSRNSILVKGKDADKPKDSHSAGNGTRTISFRNN